MMATKLGSRPSHYDVLGLTPAATAEEVGQAFARKMSLFRARPLADLAQVTAAYETLRNPEKRREYDRSLEPQPEPKPAPLAWSFALAQPTWKPFIASAPVNSAGMPPLAQPARAPEPHVTGRPEPVAPPDPRLESITASLQELAKPGFSDTNLATAAQPQPRQPKPDLRIDQPSVPEPHADAGLDQIIEHIRANGRAEREVLRQGDPRWPDWKKPVFAAGGLVLGVGILGGMAGVAAGGAAQDSVTVAVPAAKPAAKVAVAAVPGVGGTQGGGQAAEDRPVPVRMPRVRSLPKPGFSENELVELSPAVASAPAEGADSVGEQPVAAPVPASLPLPNNVIARTIERIGYSCGEIASATQGEAQGVFKVTCSSGQSYQGTPVHGRYHFRRLGGR